MFGKENEVQAAGESVVAIDVHEKQDGQSASKRHLISLCLVCLSLAFCCTADATS